MPNTKPVSSWQILVPESGFMKRLVLCFKLRHRYSLVCRRHFLPSSSNNPVESSNNLGNSHPVISPPPPPPQILQSQPSALSTTTATPLSRNSTFALSAIVASSALYNPNPKTERKRNHNGFYDAIDHGIQKSSESFKRILNHAKQTGVAASVLWHSLRSVLSLANHEVRVGLEMRVASLLADIATANASCRVALVGAVGGAVVDWLLETVATASVGSEIQAEAARALAYLVADPNVCKDVLGRPLAVANLLRFIFKCRPQRRSKKLFSGSSTQGVVHSMFLIL
ncbi:hypothetical protein SLEP1_g39220 [Rubroshorea leprosula]|uniref:Uncharacterized protein n=1 Tax=Rubroshorea leprosula TaxID=152421 RepID=A0AAV5KZU0_9ROSI|nr:hypothetical protein SLEP1_g39220 [Rubroshorea leprosula]